MTLSLFDRVDNAQILMVIDHAIQNIIHAGVWKHQLLDILTYFHHSCTTPIYFVYSLLSIYRTFTRFDNVLYDWLFPYHQIYTCMYVHVYTSQEECINDVLLNSDIQLYMYYSTCEYLNHKIIHVHCITHNYKCMKWVWLSFNLYCVLHIL